MNVFVVPDPSARWMTLIGVDGRFAATSGLSAAIAGSFQVVILPRKMPAIVGPSRLRFVIGFVSTPATLKMTTTAPSAVGTWSILVPAGRAAISVSFMAASVAPKSTVCCVMSVIPAPEPSAW